MTIAPLRVYGNGSRGVENAREQQMETAFYGGMKNAFTTMQSFALVTTVNCEEIYRETLERLEETLREHGNDLTQINAEVSIAQAADAVKHQIPAEYIGLWIKFLSGKVPEAVQKSAELLHNTEAYKEGVTTVKDATTFGYNTYIAAALAALNMVLPAWDTKITQGSDTDTHLFFDFVRDSSDYNFENNLYVLFTPPNQSTEKDVRVILEDMKMFASKLDHTLSSQRMHRGEYAAVWAQAWLDAIE
jgi:hypothetical protein